MNLENEPIENSVEIVKALFQSLVKRDDLKPKDWDDSFIFLIGIAIWDIFSNNHEVISPNNKVYDIGSWRGSGSTIAEIINHHFKEGEELYGYLDFYMGSSVGIEDKVDLLEIYKAIFALLKNYKCDWHYSHPRIYLIDFGKMKEQSIQEDNLFYDPNKAMEKELKAKEEEEKLKSLQESLDKDFEESLENAKKEPLPKVVQAFKDIYGFLPKGSQF